MRFINRADAARQLIPHLSQFKNDNVVVLAIPRGGVPIGFHIAKALHFPLELLLVKKIGHPANPEFAIGAVSLEDQILDPRQKISQAYLEEKISEIRQNLASKYKYYMGNHKPVDLKGKTLIIVDDGMATGNTIRSSIKMLRSHHPVKIVVAVPVAPPGVAQKMEAEVDALVCPLRPKNFFGVGYHYLDFSEVSDQEVIRLMRSSTI